VYSYATITEIGIIDPYSINTPACTETVGGGSPQKKKFLSFRPNNPVESSSPQHHHHRHTSQLFVFFQVHQSKVLHNQSIFEGLHSLLCL
jgi:hypothetical protein